MLTCSTFAVIFVFSLSSGSLEHTVGDTGINKAGGPFLPQERVTRTTGDTIEDPFEIQSIPTQLQGTTTGFNNDYDAECPHGGSVAPDVVYKIVLPNPMSLVLDMCGSGYDTKIYVMDGNEEVLYCNDDYYYTIECGVYVSRLETGILDGGVDYFIVVDGYGGDSGQYILDVVGFDPPIFDECDFSDLFWAEPEGEPDLVPGYIDFFNGSCEDAQGLYLGDFTARTIIGQTGWPEEGRRDTDWYNLSFYQEEEVEISLTAQYPTNLYVLRTYGDCDDYYIEEIVTSEYCIPVSVQFQVEYYPIETLIVVAPDSDSPVSYDDWTYEYLIETSGIPDYELGPSSDRGFGCPVFPAGNWDLHADLSDFSNVYLAEGYSCLGGVDTHGGDGVVSFYLEPGVHYQGVFRTPWYPTPEKSNGAKQRNSMDSLRLVSDLRPGKGICVLGATNYSEWLSFYVDEPGFYYFILDSGDSPNDDAYFRFRTTTSPPIPPDNNTCDGAEPLLPGNIILQGDLTTAGNSFDTGYKCQGDGLGNQAIGETGRDVVYAIDFLEGDTLDLHLEGQGDWDESLYLIGNCSDPVGSCLAIGSPEGSGVRLRYSAPKPHSAWLVCDSWGVGTREFVLSGTLGIPETSLEATKAFSSPHALGCYPNPFNPRTKVTFFLPEEASIKLEVFGLDGRRVKVLADGKLGSGSHFREWDGRDHHGRMVSAGTYLCRLTTPKQSTGLRLVLLK